MCRNMTLLWADCSLSGWLTASRLYTVNRSNSAFGSLGGRKGIRPVKTEWWDAGVVSGARCRFAYGAADVTATHSLAPVNPDWFILS